MTDKDRKKIINNLRENCYSWDAVSSHMYSEYGEDRTGNAWRKYMGRNKENTIEKKETITYHDGMIDSEKTISIEPENLQNTRSVLLAHGYNPTDWEIVHARHSRWEQRGKEDTHTLYASKITVRPKRSIDVDDIVGILESARPVALEKIKEQDNTGRVLELSLADIHLGRLSWAGTAGYNYDMDIGISRVRSVIQAIVARIGTERFDKIIVPVGGDLLNCDSSKGETTNGTPQDNDGRFPRLFNKTLQLMTAIIEEMRSHCNTVMVVLIPGNHDENASTMLTYAIQAWFRNCKDVTVDTTAVKRKYICFGDCMVCIGHFAEDGKNLPTVIPTEASEMWGKTKYREAHGGHLHKESVIDYGGFVLRRSPSLVSPDEWTHGKGYANRARHTTYIWHPDRGMEEIWIHGA